MRYFGSKTVRRALGAAYMIGALGACDFIEPVTADPNAVPGGGPGPALHRHPGERLVLRRAPPSRTVAMWMQQMTGTDRQILPRRRLRFRRTGSDTVGPALYTGGGSARTSTPPSRRRKKPAGYVRRNPQDPRGLPVRDGRQHLG